MSMQELAIKHAGSSLEGVGSCCLAHAVENYVHFEWGAQAWFNAMPDEMNRRIGAWAGA